MLAREFLLSDTEFSRRLNAAALACGADVPYAVVGGAAVVTGIGEDVAPVSGGKIWSGSVVLMVPPVPVPTLAFYDFFRRTRPAVSAGEDLELSRFVQRGRVILCRSWRTILKVLCARWFRP